jgi:hypothetical protein
MCHHVHVHVTLSAEDKKAAKKLWGAMIPIYASIVLAVVAAVAFTGSPQKSELVAATSVPASAR